MPPPATSASPRDRLRDGVLGAILTALVLLTFVPVLRQPFLAFDDLRSVDELRFIQDGITVDGLAAAMRADLLANWIPATVVSHMVDWELWGERAPGHYLTSLVLHAGTAVLLFAFLVAATELRLPAFFAAALWAIHPLRVESVAWLAERKDVLSGCLAAATLVLYVAWCRRGGALRYIAVSAVFGLGLLAKPMLVTLPVLLLLVDVWPLRRIARLDRQVFRVFLEKVPWLAMSALAGVGALYFQGRTGQWTSTAPDLPLTWRIENAVLAVVAYLERTFLPRDLAAFYPLSPHAPDLGASLVATLVLAGLTAAALLLWRRWPYLGFGWLWFLVAVAPVSGLIQVGRQASADRYTYLPGWGLAIALVFFTFSIAGPDRRRGVAIGMTFLVVVSGLLTRQQLRYWRDDESLFRRMVAVTADNEVGHAGLGRSLVQRGELFEGTTHLVQALRIAPGRVRLYGEVADAMARQGVWGEAERVLRKGIEVAGGDPILERQLAALLFATGRVAEAARLYAELLATEPGDPELQAQLAAALARLSPAEVKAIVDPGGDAP